jgi:steroid delta-isomerase-like uncharacterized protein
MNDKELIQTAKEIVTGYSTADWKALKNILAPDALYDEIGTQRKIKGPDQIVQALQGWKQAMTDSKGTVTNAYASGDTVTLEITWQGTHNGPFTGPTGTLPPSGKHQTTPAAMIVKFQGNKVKELHHYFDMMSFLQQIGAMTTTHA